MACTSIGEPEASEHHDGDESLSTQRCYMPHVSSRLYGELNDHLAGARLAWEISHMKPSYRSRLTVNELEIRAAHLRELLRACVVCARECGAQRLNGQRGVCRSTDVVVVSHAGPHFGEEPELVGKCGSGTIFFSSCNLKCAFCQNYQISQLRQGRSISIQELAKCMLRLQTHGCHNINLVTPTHFIPQIVEAISEAVKMGLSIPLVYNCGGYESVHTLKLLEDIVDIYMPDIKYSNNQIAQRYSGAKDYWMVVQAAVKEMHRQVGNLVCDERDIARRGLLIRHLVLPNGIGGSRAVLDFIATEISLDSYVNIMDQYHPSYRAQKIPELNRLIDVCEYDEVVEYARHAGLHRTSHAPSARI